MTDLQTNLWIAAALSVVGVYTAVTRELYHACKATDHGGRIRPFAFWCFWPAAMVMMCMAICILKRDGTGPSDQITLDDLFMGFLMRKFPQARIQNFIRRARWRSFRGIEWMHNYERLSKKFEDLRTNSKEVAELTGKELAASTIADHIEEVMESVERFMYDEFQKRVEDIKLDTPKEGRTLEWFKARVEFMQAQPYLFTQADVDVIRKALGYDKFPVDSPEFEAGHALMSKVCHHTPI